ncbi:MAG: FAD-dependent monooxygenase [Pseudomonadota bacterium]
MANAIHEFDIVIIGGGIVGATAACRLADQFARIALIDIGTSAPWNLNNPFGLRVSALNLATINLFEQINIWESVLAMRAYPYRSMYVWEQSSNAEIEFNASQTSQLSLGAIVENQVILAALDQALNANRNITRFNGHAFKNCHAISNASMLVELEDETKLSTMLLVGADGQSSQVRESVGIEVSKKDYQQFGLVAVVETEYTHQHTAWQCFNHEGPLALLPLSEKHCSMVWSVPEVRSNDLMSISETQFNQLITTGSEHKLGQLKLISERKKFPLAGLQAEHYIAERTVLMGDAAHVVHPLAGLGLNLGLADVSSLATLLANSSRALGSQRVLRQYERERKSENVIMQHSLEWIDKLFRGDQQLSRSLRSAGVNFTNKTLPLKTFFMHKALGIPV